MLLRVDEAQRAGRHPRPQDQAAWSRTTATTRRRPCWRRRNWSTRTRSSSSPATSARRRTWPRCRCSSRRTSSTSCRSPRRARCTSRFNRLKYSFAATYYDQMRTFLPKLVKEKASKKVCAIYQDDDFGLEVLRGAEAGLEDRWAWSWPRRPRSSAARPTSRRRSRKMKASGCDLVVLGTIIRETIGTIGEARKTGFNPIFLGSSAAYTDLIHKLGGKAMDGLYATMTAQIPYLDDAVAADPLLGQQVQDQVQRRPDGVLGLRLHRSSTSSSRPRRRPAPTSPPTASSRSMDSMTFPPDMFGSAAAHLQPDASGWAAMCRACRRSTTASGR